MDLAKIQHIIKFIEDNYDKKFSIQALELLSNYSYRNLQRIFKTIFKESLGVFQKRLKLENAYKKIIYTNNPICDIAIEVGFESLQSFSKAFKKQFRVSPTFARKEKLRLINTFEGERAEKEEKINCDVIYVAEKKVFFRAIKTKNYKNADINELWEKIDAEIKGDKTINYYGVIVDEPLITEKTNCRYEACIDKEINLSNFSEKVILGGRYAKFVHGGSYDAIMKAYEMIYQDWLFNSTLEFDNSPIIEHYITTNIHNNNENEFVTEILIPIKKK